MNENQPYLWRTCASQLYVRSRRRGVSSVQLQTLVNVFISGLKHTADGSMAQSPDNS